MPSSPSSTKSPSLLIEFGRPEWQAHLGGSFFGPEEHGGILQNWIGAGRCWVVLIGLDITRDYSVRLEAAPLAPFGAELQQVSLTNGQDRSLLQQTFPATSSFTSARLTLPASSTAEFSWKKLGPPVLTVSCGGSLITRLSYESRPDLQPREFLLRRDFLQPNTVLTFEPNFAVVPEADDISGERRQLSFRLFRLMVSSEP